jgi:hypothetical protein
MNDTAWEITHSVDADASPAFAWAYMTNTSNWDDPPATFELDGPFAAGSRGTTHTPGQEPRHWYIREVVPMKSYTFEMPLDGAAISVNWQFAALAERGTRLTQRIVLHGENAAMYVPPVEAAFTANLAPGMERIVAAMERAEAGGNQGTASAG